MTATTPIKPIHLTGAACSDYVIRNGKRVGIMYHWAKDGVSVQLIDPVPVTVAGVSVLADHVVITDAMFASGEFTWEKRR